jgi:diacylglycerol kinase (ATP)
VDREPARRGDGPHALTASGAAVRILVIANPAAGLGRAGGRVGALARRLRARGHEVDVVVTSGRGDASRHAAAAEGKVDCLVAAGGDGTLAEVVNGLADPGSTLLVPMPAGTANMLARALGVPRDPAALAALVEHGAPRRLDLGVARFADGTTRRFLSVAGIGFDAEVTRTLARTRRGRLGFRGYVAPIAGAFLRHEPAQLAVRLDGGPPIACGFAIVGRLANYGGVLRITPDAEPDDGLLHACLFLRAGRLDLLRFVLPAFRGRLAERPDVLARAVRALAIEATAPAPVQLDGDYVGTTPVVLTLAARAVPVLAAATRRRKPAASG